MASVWVNGQASLTASVYDRALQFGDGVFRTMRVRQGQIVLAAEQLARLRQDAASLHITPPSEELLQSWVQQALKMQPEGVLKIVLSRGESQRGYAVPIGSQTNCIIYASPVPAHAAQWRQDGVVVRMCSLRLAAQPALAGIKHLNRLENVLARLEWKDPQIAEGLLLDQRDQLVEGTMSNLFWYTGQRWYTPTLDTCGVAGVMRQQLIQHSGAEEVLAGLDALLAADEVFICNSVIGIVPVRQLNNTNWEIGPQTRGLQEMWRDAFDD